jgi:predicted ATP-dependent endonuclease of OLD family
MNSIVNEGFFGNVVFVVEGQTEVGMFTALAARLALGWDEKGIVVVPAEGKNNLDRPVIVFEGLQIPVYWAFDTDESIKEEREKQRESEKNIKLQKVIGHIDSPEGFPQTSVGERCAAFRNKIEDHIRSELGDAAYLAIRGEVAADLGYSSDEKQKDVLKNVTGASLFLHKVYDRGLHLAKLEEIVRKVTALATT